MKRRGAVGGASALLIVATLCLTGCFYAEERRKVRENDEKARIMNEEIQKEIDRKKQMEESVK